MASMVETDMISNLPEDVKRIILTYLPIKEAGRTSILSTKWRYIWASIPELAVDETESISNLEKFVDAILLLHVGPIRTFSLSTMKPYNEAFDRWIVNLSRNGIRELTLHTLDFSLDISVPPYMMHSGFFSCDELNYINLSACSFRVPNGFKGFKLLHTLALDNLEVPDGEVEKLILRCPLLRELDLFYLLDLPVTLNIDSSNLLRLWITGEFTDLRICAPNLRFLHLELRLDDANPHNLRHNVERVCGNLPELERFELIGSFSEYFCVVRKGISLTFNRLKNLHIFLHFGTEKEAAIVLALFQGAPHLQSIYIVANSNKRPALKFWETVNKKEDLFKHLKKIKIFYSRGAEAIFSLAKFILDSASQLEALTLKKEPNSKEDDGTILKQLLLLQRASTKAQIIFK